MDETLVDSSPQSDDFHALSPSDCLDKLASGWSPWVLDVRLQTENDIVALPFTHAVVPHRTVHLDHIPKEALRVVGVTPPPSDMCSSLLNHPNSGGAATQ